MPVFNFDSEITSHARRRHALHVGRGVGIQVTHFSVGNQGHDENDPQSPDTSPPPEFPTDQILKLKELTYDALTGEFVGTLEGDEAIGLISSYYVWATVVFDPEVDSKLAAAGFSRGLSATVPISILQSGIGDVINDPGVDARLTLSPAQQLASPSYSGFSAADVGRIIEITPTIHPANRGTFEILSVPDAATVTYSNPTAPFESNVQWQLAESLSLAPLQEKEPVMLESDLPVSGNTPGDKRTVLYTGRDYWWTGTIWEILTDRYLYSITRTAQSFRTAGVVDTIRFTLIN